MYSSCNTKWWITLAWIRRHETTSKRKLAYEWPTAHMSKNLIHNFVSFLFLYFVAWEFSFPYIVFISEIFEKNRKSDYFFNFLWILFCSAATNFAKSPHFSVRETGVEPVRTSYCPKDFKSFMFTDFIILASIYKLYSSFSKSSAI